MRAARRRILRTWAVVAGLALATASSGCVKKRGPRLAVAVTIFPIYDLARTIAGPDADVVLLVPPGHSIEEAGVAAQNAGSLSGVKLGIMVGLGLDTWMTPLLDRAAPSAHRLVVGDRVPTIPIPKGAANAESAGASPRGPDPYVWLDPERAILMAEAIAEEMAHRDASHAADYRRRSFSLQQDLDALDHEIERRVASWKTRSFASLPSAFAYYGDRYHLDVAAFTPGPGDGALDPIGGRAETDTYDKLLRFDTDALEKTTKTSP